jgi:hypothetical protein
MAHADDQALTDQITRILRSLEWDVVATDLTGDRIQITIQRDKTPTTTRAIGQGKTP